MITLNSRQKKLLQIVNASIGKCRKLASEAESVNFAVLSQFLTASANALKFGVDFQLRANESELLLPKKQEELFK